MRTALRPFLLLLLAVSLLCTGCGTAAPSARRPRWLISTTALDLLAGAGLRPDERTALFDTPDTYLIHGADASTGYGNAVRTQTFTSAETLRGALDHGIDPAVRAVLYDNENWSLTPSDEQRHPADATARAAAAAHAHQLPLIATPATDLTRVLAPGEPSYPAYLRLGIAAASADVIDIQAQGSEADTAKFADFVRRAAAQARQRNPHVVVLAGLSTNPSGQRVTTDQLRQAVAATRSFVDGYWLNIPAEGTACPRCGTPRPEVAVPLLRELLNS
ncbi:MULTISPECIES: hypothetical protein [unclassified Nocardia]|uniref:hypothetical protein n=1 Tax=unclassified Nocardia TaxID=2637762 RepID=UPI001CE3FFB4|nr:MULTISPECIES: hypothetical protein [unclassified Nocardia]